MTDRVPMHADADILIVDDNAANVELLLALLEDEGYLRLDGITDPRKVAARVAERAPDLILLDVRMPHLSGFDLMEQLSAGAVEAPAAGAATPRDTVVSGKDGDQRAGNGRRPAGPGGEPRGELRQRRERSCGSGPFEDGPDLFRLRLVRFRKIVQEEPEVVERQPSGHRSVSIIEVP